MHVYTLYDIKDSEFFTKVSTVQQAALHRIFFSLFHRGVLPPENKSETQVRPLFFYFFISSELNWTLKFEKQVCTGIKICFSVMDLS